MSRARDFLLVSLQQRKALGVSLEHPIPGQEITLPSCQKSLQAQIKFVLVTHAASCHLSSIVRVLSIVTFKALSTDILQKCWGKSMESSTECVRQSTYPAFKKNSVRCDIRARHQYTMGMGWLRLKPFVFLCTRCSILITFFPLQILICFICPCSIF